jgi:hypothetical protein
VPPWLAAVASCEVLQLLQHKLECLKVQAQVGKRGGGGERLGGKGYSSSSILLRV